MTKELLNTTTAVRTDRIGDYNKHCSSRWQSMCLFSTSTLLKNPVIACSKLGPLKKGPNSIQMIKIDKKNIYSF